MTPAFILIKLSGRWRTFLHNDQMSASHQDQGCSAGNKHLLCGWLILHFLVISSACKAHTESRQIKMLNSEKKFENQFEVPEEKAREDN